MSKPDDEEETLPRSHVTAALLSLHDSFLLSQTSFPDSPPGRHPVPLATNVLPVNLLGLSVQEKLEMNETTLP